MIGTDRTTRAAAITLATRHLGFERTGRKIKAAFHSAITGLVRQGKLEYDGKLIRKA